MTIYVVRAGDTLVALADRFDTTVESLSYWNRARYPSLDPESSAYAPNRIEAGWRLGYIPGEVVDRENLPPAAASTTPAPSVEPFPVLPADGRALLVSNGPRGSDAVSLIFDYGGGPGAGAPAAAGAEATVQWLVANRVAATVFVAPPAADPADASGQAVLARLGAAGPGVTRPAASTPRSRPFSENRRPGTEAVPPKPSRAHRRSNRRSSAPRDDCPSRTSSMRSWPHPPVPA